MELPICQVLLIKVICSKSWSDVQVYVLHKNMSFFNGSHVKGLFFAVLCSAYIIWFVLHWQVEDKFKLTLEYTNTCSLSDTDIGSFLASNITNTLRMIVGLDENETIGNVNEHSLFGNKKKFLFFFVIAVVYFLTKTYTASWVILCITRDVQSQIYLKSSNQSPQSHNVRKAVAGQLLQWALTSWI